MQHRKLQIEAGSFKLGLRTVWECPREKLEGHPSQANGRFIKQPSLFLNGVATQNAGMAVSMARRLGTHCTIFATFDRSNCWQQCQSF